MTTDRDDALERRYREASAALDERPAAATRAAILAAAARQGDAGPQAADAPRPVRRRWPVAAAAAVLLSSLAVMLAHRTEQEMPTFTVPAERASESVAVAPVQPPLAKPKAEDAAAPLQAPSAVDSAAAAPSGTRDASPAGAKKTAPAIAREQQGLAAEAPAERAPAPQSDASNAALAKQRALPAPDAPGAESRQAFPAAPAATLPAPPAAPPALARTNPPPASAPASAGAVSPQGLNEAATPKAPTDFARSSDRSSEPAARREAAPVPQAAGRQDAAREFERSAQEWLERIVKLRSEGRDAEADAELKRFRERYPQVHVPPAAMPPAGAAPGTR